MQSSSRFSSKAAICAEAQNALSARRGLESVVRVATGVLTVGTTEVGTNFGWHAPWGEFRC